MKESENGKFTFNVSLSVLDHLGRNLYRSFVTVLGEAISNSWDAGAQNVWIEMDTTATSVGNSINPYLRPSDTEYIPVIITNSDIETVNQENGLVRFNIEYTLAHKVQTQRN